jgi:hypothetical protein
MTTDAKKDPAAEQDLPFASIEELIKRKRKDNLKIESISLESWGCSFWMRKTSGREGEFWEDEIQKNADKDGNVKVKGLKLTLIILCACNSDGSPMFSDEHRKWFQDECSSEQINDLFDAIRKHNGLIGPEEQERLEGNSETPTAESDSGLD